MQAYDYLPVCTEEELIANLRDQLELYEEVMANRYERNQKARRECVAKKGY